MFKKIAIYTGYLLLVGALIAYFILSTKLERSGSAKVICKRVDISILDSSVNQFVSIEEIGELIREQGITAGESKIKHINLHQLEQILNNRTAVKVSQINYNGAGVMMVRVEQRRPVLRIETVNGGFYIDDSGYIFPLVKSFTSFVPVVTGHIPLSVAPGYRGRLKENKEWSDQMVFLGNFIDQHELFDAQIEQIDVDEKGNLYIIPRVGQHLIVFGKPDNVEAKFKKLMAFYEHIVPNAGWDKYSLISLQYENQIVCTKREGIKENKINIEKNLNI
jgi:cell division protein FtsQ